MTSSDLKSPLYLLITGSLLAASVILSKYVAGFGVAMLWFLSFALIGGAMLLAGVAMFQKLWKRENFKMIFLFSIGAGLFHALPNTLAYMSVVHVGAGYVTLAYSFPLLLTYLISLAIGLDKWHALRLVAVLSALAGGVLLAMDKFSGLSDTGQATIWVFAASAIPFIIAFGNIYRTRYWPKGATPLILASLMLLLAGCAILPFAVGIQGAHALESLFSAGPILLLLGLNSLLFALQFVFYFKLQQEAGPVYLSQIGSVSAVIGTPVGVLYFNEQLPDIFIYAVILIIIGVVLFQKPIKPQ